MKKDSKTIALRKEELFR